MQILERKTLNQMFLKRKHPWNKGTIGIMKAWNKGKKLPPLSLERKKKIGESLKGKNTWSKGSKNSIETRKKKSIARKGQLNPNWKGGITTFKRRLRTCSRYRQWRSNVFTRDNFICQICAQRGRRLNADHFPKSFAKIIKENNIKSMEEAENCEELWEIANGRTLCIECHRKTDNFLKNTLD